MFRSSVSIALLSTLGMGAALAEDPTPQAASKTAAIVVYVSNVASDAGNVDCALFSSEKGFPMDATSARQSRHTARTGTVECRFENLPAGTYAVAVSHDENKNGKTDTNFLGIPKEAWGVSNNVRPKMRAPKFSEAKFDLTEGEALKLEIAVK